MASIINAGTTSNTALNMSADTSGTLDLQSNGTTMASVTSTGFNIGGAVASGFTMKNRIINGDMVIDQRNAGASVTPTNGQFTVDRWQALASVSSKYTTQQNAGSVTPPDDFTNYLGATSTSAYSVGSGDYFYLLQKVEGFNASDLKWGTANAKTVTLSFKVRSSLTGTFVVAIRSGADDAAYPATYTINSANTWETKSITIPGPTSGTFATTNAACFGVWFSLGAGSGFNATANTWGVGGALSVSGSVSVVGTNGATLYITGVQLERGSQATSFEWLPYGQKLINCYRYFRIYNKEGTMYGVGANNGATTAYRWGFIMDVAMRATPTVAFNSVVGWTPNGGVGGNISVQSNISSINALDFDLNYSSGSATQGIVFKAYLNTAASSITVSAEL